MIALGVACCASVGLAAPPGPYVALRIDYERHEPGPTDRDAPMTVGEQRGSGVVVGPGQSGTWLVLTNAHVVEVDPAVGQAVPQIFAGGKWRRGQVVAEDSAADLALVRVALDEPLRSAGIATGPPDNRAEVTTHGYAGGTKYCRRTTELRHAMPLDDGALAWASDRYFVQTTFHPGESGGAVTIGGKLVGLIHGNDSAAGWGLVVDQKAIAAFLKPWLPTLDADPNANTTADTSTTADPKPAG